MKNTVNAIGHGLLAAGLLLTVTYFFVASLRGAYALREALDPLDVKFYMALLPLAPGAIIILMSDFLKDASQRRDKL
jgi:hypothetical protein